MRAVALSAAIVSGALAGCGGGTHASRSLAQGREIFASQCAGCHTLTGREEGAVGGDLVIAHLRERDLASFARVMPTKRPLGPAAARAVASYIAGVAAAKR